MKKFTFLNLLFLFCCCGIASAQFTASISPEILAGNSAGVQKTNTDAKRVPYLGTVPFLYATVWDGANPAIRWTVPASGLAGTIPLPAGTSIPDVVLSSTPNFTNTYLLVVYRSGASFFLSRYQWLAAGTFAAPTTSVLLAVAAGATAPSINIDADNNGNYAIIAGRADGAIRVWGNSNATLPGAPLIHGTLGVGTGGQTDICLNNVGSSPNSEHISYTNTAATVLFTQSHPFAAGLFTPQVTVAPAAAGINYYDPRIACPERNPSGCPGTDMFSIIYDEIAPAQYTMYLYSQNCAGTNSAKLTVGNPGFPVPLIQFNKRPALSFNRKFNYSSGGVFANEGAVAAAWVCGDPGRSVIGERLRTDGTTWPGYLSYYDVPNPTRTNCDHVSVSAKYSDDRVFMSFYDGATSNIINKEFSYATPTMRSGDGGSQTELVAVKPLVSIFPNPSRGDVQVQLQGITTDEKIQLQINDLAGRMIMSTQNTGSEIQQQVKNWFAGASKGVYMVRFTGSNGLNSMIKLVKE
jgi:hypothetical protein